MKSKLQNENLGMVTRQVRRDAIPMEITEILSCEYTTKFVFLFHGSSDIKGTHDTVCFSYTSVTREKIVYKTHIRTNHHN